MRRSRDERMLKQIFELKTMKQLAKDPGNAEANIILAFRDLRRLLGDLEGFSTTEREAYSLTAQHAAAWNRLLFCSGVFPPYDFFAGRIKKLAERIQNDIELSEKQEVGP